MDEAGTTVASGAGQDRLVDRTRALLREGVPLSLLLDLADPAGPDSAGRFASEPADLGWLHPTTPPG